MKKFNFILFYFFEVIKRINNGRIELKFNCLFFVKLFWEVFFCILLRGNYFDIFECWRNVR